MPGKKERKAGTCHDESLTATKYRDYIVQAHLNVYINFHVDVGHTKK